MHEAIVVSGIISLIGIATAGLIGGIFRLTTAKRNGTSGARIALNPEDVKSGDMAASFWLHEHRKTREVLSVHASKMESFGVKLDALSNEMRAGFGATNTLLTTAMMLAKNAATACI